MVKVDIQKWLDKEYPKDGVCLGEFDGLAHDWDLRNKGKKREEVKELDLRPTTTGKKLGGVFTGELNLLGFNNLEQIWAWGNKFTNINLEAIRSDKLFWLDIRDSDIKENINLVQFSRFSNLKILVLDGNPGVFGSLENLKNLKKLDKLDLSNTNVEGKIEDLPLSIQSLGYSGTKVSDPVISEYKYEPSVGDKLLNWKKQQVIDGLELTGEEAEKLRTANRDNFSEILNEIVTNRAERLGSKLTPEKKSEIKEKTSSIILQSGKEESIKEIEKLKQLVLKLQNENEELREKLTRLGKEKESVKVSIEKKRKGLELLKKKIITDNHLEEKDLEKLAELLEKQEEVIEKNNEEKIVKRLENAKRRLKDSITEKEINNLCQLQTEITKLEIEINEKQQQITNIYNTIGISAGGDVNVRDFVVEGATINHKEQKALMEIPTDN